MLLLEAADGYTLLPETIQPAKRHKQNEHKQSQPTTREVGSPLWGLMPSEVLIKKTLINSI